MSEFTEKLNSSELVSNAWDEIDKDQANAGLLIDVIKSEFKDWQPPKPREIPVEIPQFVAGWFEEKMSVAFSEVVSAYSFSGNEAIAWVYENGGIDLLCKMKLYGYTVEKPKEKLYFVKLPGITSLDAHLCKSCSPGEIGYHEVYSSKEPNKISFSSRYDKKYSGGWQRQFTESEIKAIDERYWTFAVPVL